VKPDEPVRTITVDRDLAKKLVPLYRVYPAIVAQICDEILDRRGALLGWVRDESK
jgi:hypothetical protein